MPVMLCNAEQARSSPVCRAIFPTTPGRVLSYTFLGAIAGAGRPGPGIVACHRPLVLGGCGPADGPHRCDPARPCAWLEPPGGGGPDLAAPPPSPEHRKPPAGQVARRGVLRWILTPLLPCGMLYAMVLKAAETGSASSGALTMLAFAVGTVPALLLTGMATTFLSVRLRLHATRIAALVVIAMGMLLMVRGVGKMGM